jgi:hypothetical protein
VANPAFLQLAQLGSESRAKGQSLTHWIGLADEPLAALVAKVRRDGIARHVGASFRRQAAPPAQIEIAAALLTEGDQECIGFTIHPTGLTTGHPDWADAADDNALIRVLRAGIEALSAQHEPEALAALLGETATLLGMEPERLSQQILRGRGRADPQAPGAGAP